MPKKSDLRPLRDFFPAAFSSGWERDPRKPAPRLRDAAANGRFPAKMIEHVWHYDPADIDNIAPAVGLRRAEIQKAA